ncbi:hypothetical protein [Anaerobaca lacustris]|uniref:Uncharacterized protein n=1 Tax=Anaerobaca lacustris TaxID=3044600 RepID=A0AAW6TYP5_9BACT|nr:hypothetical protein [Sedimentisphaerales bacterium M17dextr]
MAQAIETGPRFVSCGPEQPSRWWFGKVKDPRSDTYFTANGAWEFVAECLRDSNAQIEEIMLKKPRGEIGYVLKVQLEQGELYVKLQMGTGGAVIGRSFHLSERK